MMREFMSDALVLTLGHNSSAILIRKGSITCGYETERLTAVKSDSTFPLLPIQEIHRRYHIAHDADVYVSHWDLEGRLDQCSRKHWNPGIISEICPNGNIVSVSPAFTHHDAHAWSGALFAGPNFPSFTTDNSYVIVIDGFGTYGEHMSIYRYVNSTPVLLERKFGFASSLGLLYQYATAFLGMKQNQDEYKLLAYEAHISEVSEIDMEKLEKAIDKYSKIYVSRLSAYMTVADMDPVLSVAALPTFAKSIADMLNAVLTSINGTDLSERHRRIVIAYFVQSVVETVVLSKITEYAPGHVILVGGVFLNVKLNSCIASMIPGLTCIMPLAGDQGAGLGVYKAMHPGLEWPGHLFWGDRTLRADQFEGIENIVYEPSGSVGHDMVADELSRKGMVNVVHGAMEFGPRALGHTSTIALPTPDIATEINKMNLRTNEMPFAPMMTEEQAKDRLIGVPSIHKSLDYMICTREFREGRQSDMMGAAHKYPLAEAYSARPQIVRDGNTCELLERFGPLINTSYNFHGVPIVWNADQIRHTHVLEQEAASINHRPKTIVIGNEP